MRAAASSRWRSASSRSTFRARAGSSTTPIEIWQSQRATIADGCMPRRRRRATSPRWASPISAKPRCCGIAPPAHPWRPPSSGRTAVPPTPASTCARRATSRKSPRARGCCSIRISPATKLAWLLDQIPGRARPRGARRTRLRHDRQLAAVQAHRPPPPRHRRHQCQPYAAAQPAHRRRGTTGCSSCCACRAPACPTVVDSCLDASAADRDRTRTASNYPSPASPATSRRRCSARPASRPAWRRTPTAPAASRS